MQFMGLCSYTVTNEHYPQLISIDKVDGVAFEGRVKWPTLNSAETKMRGKCEGATFSFEEYEVITGVDDVEVPASYTGEITGTSVIGKLLGSDDVTIKLDLIPGAKATPPPPAAAPAPPAPAVNAEIAGALKEGAELAATLTLTLRCTLRVERGGDIGTLEWPAAVGGYHTRVRLAPRGDDVAIDEFEVLPDKGGVPAPAVPRHYALQLHDADHALVGKAYAGVAAAAAAAAPAELGELRIALKK